MKKKPVSVLTTHFPNLRKLYLDDLETISGLIEEQSLTITFSDDEYDYDSLDEVVTKKGGQVSRLVLTAAPSEDRPYNNIKIRFERDRIGVTSDPEFELPYRRVTDYLESRIGSYKRVLSQWAWGTAMFFSIALNQVLLTTNPSRHSATISVVIWVGTTAMFMLSTALHSFGRKISLSRKHESPGFFSRNFDRIAMLFLGVVLTLVGQYLLAQLTK